MKHTTLTMSKSKAKRHELDLGLVRYSIATNTPFLAVTNKNFKNLESRKAFEWSLRRRKRKGEDEGQRHACNTRNRRMVYIDKRTCTWCLFYMPRYRLLGYDAFQHWYMAVKDILDFLKRVAVMLDKLQSEQCMLSTTFHFGRISCPTRRSSMSIVFPGDLKCLSLV